jgi:hypothetical protein
VWLCIIPLIDHGFTTSKFCGIDPRTIEGCLSDPHSNAVYKNKTDFNFVEHLATEGIPYLPDHDSMQNDLANSMFQRPKYKFEPKARIILVLYIAIFVIAK